MNIVVSTDGTRIETQDRVVKITGEDGGEAIVALADLRRFLRVIEAAEASDADE